MTREEAINTLKEIKITLETYNEWVGTKLFYKYPQALDMAISALQTIDNCDQCEWCCPSDGTPTIHVVRCKNCRYKRLYDEGDTKYYYCALEDRPNRQWSVDDTDYCSWGEKREKGGVKSERE